MTGSAGRPLAAPRDDGWRRPLVLFGGLLVVLSVPLWLLDPLLADVVESLPIRLPPSAVMAVLPMVVALALRRSFPAPSAVRPADRRPPALAAAALVVPAAAAASEGVLVLTGRALPPTDWAELLPALALMVVVFTASAITEELGFHRYLTRRLAADLTPGVVGTVVGAVWALWHLWPWVQLGHDPRWVVGQFALTVLARVLIVHLGAEGARLAPAVALHASLNVAAFAFPVYGSAYDPFIVSLLLGAGMAVWELTRRVTRS